MSAKAIRPKIDKFELVSEALCRAWISAAWRDKPFTRVVPSKRVYKRTNKYDTIKSPMD